MSFKQAAASRFGLRLTSLAAQCLTVAALSMTTLSVRADDIADVQKLLAAGKNTEALQKADQYLNGKPRDPMMRFLRGISLSQAGRSTEAVTVFTKLTEDYPELPEPFNNLAVLYAQQGQYDKAAERDVASAVERWAAAWSRKDMNGYYAAYTRDFDGGKGSRKAWEAERRARIVSKRSIDVEVSNISVDIKGDKASVRYRQAYRADNLNINSTKRLEMVRSGGKWLIAKESAGS